MAVVYRQPQKSPWEPLEELTPQWIQMLTDWRKIDAATELKQQEAAVLQANKDRAHNLALRKQDEIESENDRKEREAEANARMMGGI